MVRTLPQTVFFMVNLEGKGRQGLISGFFPPFSNWDAVFAYSWKFPAYNGHLQLAIVLAYNFRFFCLQLELFCLQSESASNKGL